MWKKNLQSSQGEMQKKLIIHEVWSTLRRNCYFKGDFYLKARRLKLSPSGRISCLQRRSSSCRREDGAEELVHAALLVDEPRGLLEHLQETRRPQHELLADVPRLSPPSASSWKDR